MAIPQPQASQQPPSAKGARQTDPLTAFVPPPVVLLRTAERLAGQPAYAVRTPEGWQHTTWQTYGAEVRLAARALLTLGVRPEDIRPVATAAEADLGTRGLRQVLGISHRGHAVMQAAFSRPTQIEMEAR